jgi:hypothetical protein
MLYSRKGGYMKSRHKSSPKQQHRPDETKVEGQNPQANDSPELSVYHDENRRNMYDPEVGEALRRDDDKPKTKPGVRKPD